MPDRGGEGEQVLTNASGLRHAMGDLPAGHVIRAHIATVLRIRDGRIAEQRNYDCYEPFSRSAER